MIELLLWVALQDTNSLLIIKNFMNWEIVNQERLWETSSEDWFYWFYFYRIVTSQDIKPSDISQANLLS